MKYGLARSSHIDYLILYSILRVCAGERDRPQEFNISLAEQGDYCYDLGSSQMNVWGKRSASVAFPNSAIFDVLVAGGQLIVGTINPLGPGGININGPGIAVQGGVECSSIICAGPAVIEEIQTNVINSAIDGGPIIVTSNNGVTLSTGVNGVVIPTGGLTASKVTTSDLRASGAGPIVVTSTNGVQVNGAFGVQAVRFSALTGVGQDMSLLAVQGKIYMETRDVFGGIHMVGYVGTGLNAISLEADYGIKCRSVFIQNDIVGNKLETPLIQANAGSGLTVSSGVDLVVQAATNLSLVSGTAMTLDSDSSLTFVSGDSTATLNGAPFVLRSYTSTHTLGWSPSGGVIQTAFPDGTAAIPIVIAADTWLLGRSMEIEIQGHYTTPGAVNNMEFYVYNGAALVFTFVTTATVSPPSGAYNFRASIKLVTALVGTTLRAFFQYSESDSAFAVAPTTEKTTFQSVAFDPTNQFDLDVRYKTQDPAADVATQFALVNKIF